MKFIDLVRRRRSVRKYSARPVPQSEIEKCLEAVRLAPSAQNSQPWRFAVISGKTAVDRFSRDAFTAAYRVSAFAARASAIVVLLSKLSFVTHTLGRQVQDINFWTIDMGIGGEHLVLQAQELGIGTCWIGWFSQKGVRRHLGIPRDWKIAGLIAMGYPDGKSSQGNPHRKPMDDLVYKWID